LTQTNLNDLIIKYNIPCDLHPRLLASNLVISDRLDDAIGIYHRFSKCSVNKKSGFFFIDRRAIPDYMSWRHPNSVITDSKPPTGSYNQSDVRRLSASIAHPLEASFYYTPAAADVVILTPTLKDLFAEAPNTKVLAKAEASKKRKASTSGSALSQVAKRTRSATTNFSRSSVRPNLFNDDSDDEESDDDHDACVKILLVTPICSVATIPLGGSQSRGSIPLQLKVLEEKLLWTMLLTHPLGVSVVLELLLVPLLLLEILPVLDLNDKVTASDVSFVNANAKGKDQKKKIKSLSKCLDQFTAEAAQKDVGILRVCFFLLKWIPEFGSEIVDHFAYPLFALIELKPDRLVRSSAVLTLKVAGVFLYFLKELTMTLASSLMELFPKDAPPSSVATTKQHSREQDKKWLTTMVDTADEDMFHAASSKLVEVLVRRKKVLLPIPKIPHNCSG
nr:hypothetical protein [Tanacetum cinerariifolium]